MEAKEGVVAALPQRLRTCLGQLPAILARLELRPLDAVVIAGVLIAFRSRLRPIHRCITQSLAWLLMKIRRAIYAQKKVLIRGVVRALEAGGD